MTKFIVFDTFTSERLKPRGKKRDHYLTRFAAQSRCRSEMKTRNLPFGIIVQKLP